MKCPKCGFDQPEDRFCANCGVDVALYVPKRKILKSLLRSTTFYILLSTFVLVFGIWFLMTRAGSNVSSFNTDRTNSVFRKTRPTSETNEPDVGGTASQEAPTPPPPESFQPPAAAPTVPTPAPTQALKPKATTFRLSFYEVDYGYASTLLGANVDGSLGVGVVAEEGKFAERLKAGSDNGVARRIGSSVQTISTDEQTPNTFSFVSTDPRINGEIGLMFHLRAGQITDTGSAVSIDGRRIIGRDDSPQADVLNFQRDVTIPLKAPAYIVGLVRGRNPVDTNEMNAFSANPVFSIFRSERFRSNQSLLVVLIEAVERP